MINSLMLQADRHHFDVIYLYFIRMELNDRLCWFFELSKAFQQNMVRLEQIARQFTHNLFKSITQLRTTFTMSAESWRVLMVHRLPYHHSFPFWEGLEYHGKPGRVEHATPRI